MFSGPLSVKTPVQVSLTLYPEGTSPIKTTSIERDLPWTFEVTPRCHTPLTNEIASILARALKLMTPSDEPLSAPSLTEEDVSLMAGPLMTRVMQCIQAINSIDLVTLSSFQNYKELEQTLPLLLHRIEALKLHKFLTSSDTCTECLLKGLSDPSMLYKMTIHEKEETATIDEKETTIHKKILLIEQIDLLADFLREKLPNLPEEYGFLGTVLVNKGPNPIFTFASPNFNPETRFNIGSMSKMFTSVAILQLVKGGMIKLTDTIGSLLKEWKNIPPEMGKATIEDLLTNTCKSGKYATRDFRGAPPLDLPQDYLAFYGKIDLFFQSDDFNDPHFNFIVLGYIIQIVSRVDYYTYIKENIYSPAGMLSSDSYYKERLPANTAPGIIGTDNAEDHLRYLPSRGSPAGGGYSTVIDLSRFASALQDGKLLDEKHLQLLVSFLTLQDERFYGYGFEVCLTAPRWFGQDVKGLGVSGSFRIYPDSSHVVVVLSKIKGTSQKVADLIRSKLPQEVKEGSHRKIHRKAKVEKDPPK